MAPHPWATKVAANLEQDPVWAKLLRGEPGSTKIKEIPSLSRRLRSYRLADFQTIARHIRTGAIELQTVFEPSGHPAQYFWRANLLALNTANSSDPADARSYIVHEAAHAIQDDRRMYLSKPEAEQDAHFVHALYCVEAEREDEVADYAVKGKKLARDFLAAGRLDRQSETFKEFCSDISTHYANLDTAHAGDFDKKAQALKRERHLRNGIRG